MTFLIDDADIDLQILQERGLVLPTAKYLKIYNSGTGVLTKKFHIVANAVTINAIYAIDAADGSIDYIVK